MTDSTASASPTDSAAPTSPSALPALTATTLSVGSGDRVLVVLPSLGTAVEPLWRAAAQGLPDTWTVVGVDLPGNGRSAPVAPTGPATTAIAALADAVLTAVRAALPGTEAFTVAGDSVGGTIALQLALDHPETVQAAAVFCTGAKIGAADACMDRAAHVETAGAESMVEGSKQRWFDPGFLDSLPDISAELLDSLAAADARSYAAVCRALAAFDVRDRLAEISTPVLAVAGEHDEVTTAASLEEISSGITAGQLVVVDDAGHLVPAEAPAATAGLLTSFLG